MTAMGLRLTIARAAVREHLTYDLGAVAGPVARGVFAVASRMVRSSSPASQARGFALLMRLHSARSRLTWIGGSSS